MTCECDGCEQEKARLYSELQEWKNQTMLWRRRYGECSRELAQKFPTYRPGGR